MTAPALRSIWGLVLALVLALGACGRSPIVHYYTLVGARPAALAPLAGPSIVVGPVAVPETVDRPEIVLRVSPTRLALTDEHQWAEPLAEEIARAMADDLAIALPHARVAAGAPPGEVRPDWEVRVSVQRFDSALDVEAIIEALWSVRRADGGVVKTGRSLVRVAAAGRGYDALVAAHARAVAQLSGEIAEVIRAEAPVAGR